MKKALKILKITLLTLLGLLIVAAIAGVILYQTTFKEPVQEMIASIDNLIESGELFEIEDGLDLSPSASLTGNGEIPGETQAEQTPDSSSESINSPAPTGAKTPKKPVEEYNNTYDYVKDNVAPSDFAKGSSYALRVDIGYILGLLSGGLTTSEKKELKQYLLERFSQAEIDEGIALYKKYSYLLKEASKK